MYSGGVVLGAIVILIVMINILNSKNSNENYIITIGNLEVSKEELVFSIGDKKQEVKNIILTTYGVNPNDFDWNDTYGEKRGYECILDEALLKVKKEKVIQEEAINAGIIEKFNYAAFSDMLEEENTSRSSMIASGKAVFGPEQYTEKQYYKYLNNNLLIQVKEYLIKNNLLEVSEEEIKQVYEENKEYFNNEELEAVKENVKLLCYDIKMEQFINEKVEHVLVTFDTNEIMEIVKEELK